MKKLFLLIIAFVFLATGLCSAQMKTGIMTLDDVLAKKKLSRADIIFKNERIDDILDPLIDDWETNRTFREVWVKERPLYHHIKSLGRRIRVYVDHYTWQPSTPAIQERDLIVIPAVRVVDKKVIEKKENFYKYQPKE